MITLYYLYNSSSKPLYHRASFLNMRWYRTVWLYCYIFMRDKSVKSEDIVRIIKKPHETQWWRFCEQQIEKKNTKLQKKNIRIAIVLPINPYSVLGIKDNLFQPQYCK